MARHKSTTFTNDIINNKKYNNISERISTENLMPTEMYSPKNNEKT